MTMADTVAVMNAGRIEQMGAPEDLYDLPRTAFVANFLGRSNLMAGRVAGGAASGGLLEVEAAGQRLLLDPERAVSTEGEVLVGVRPEKIALRPAGTRAGGQPVVVGTRGAVNEVDGTVTDVSFTGVSTEYRVDVPGLGELGVFAQNRESTRIRPGDPVELTWDPSRAFGLDGAEDASAGEDAT